MENSIASSDFPSLRPEDRVRHPRLGTGRGLRFREDGSVVIWFDGRDKPDILFPFQLVRIDPDHTSGCSTSLRKLDYG